MNITYNYYFDLGNKIIILTNKLVRSRCIFSYRWEFLEGWIASLSNFPAEQSLRGSYLREMGRWDLWPNYGKRSIFLKIFRASIFLMQYVYHFGFKKDFIFINICIYFIIEETKTFCLLLFASKYFHFRKYCI